MDFSATGGGVPSGYNDYFWFDRDTTEPIRISVDLILNEEEFEEFFKPLPKSVLDYIRHQLGEKSLQISVCRQIVSPQVGWRTEYLKWGDIPLVKDDKPTGLDELSKLLIPREAAKDFILCFFTPQEFAGDRLLVNKSRKVAYFSNSQIDSLVSAGLIEKSTETVGQNFREWTNQQGIKLVERPPTQDEIPFLMQPITTDLLNSLLANISNNIKGKFRFVPAARDEKNCSWCS